MRLLFDRLYGRVCFPKLVDTLVDCPGVLRLRHIGMANVDFFAFPSFSAVTRYEHSLGVCHLSQIAAEALDLPTKDKYELMIAALYHDVTTPPFAHATEEFLRERYGFDHELRLSELVTGTSADVGKSRSQVFEGQALKLPEYAKTAAFRKDRINLYRIPNLVFGDSKDCLSNLISGDVDLDNIDNVVRAAAAMGITGANGKLAETLARSFVRTVDGNIGLSADAEQALLEWTFLRSQLYDMILCSIDDFSLQTMLKHCLQLLADSEDPDIQLTAEDWKLTEPELLSRMGSLPECRQVLRRMRLRRLFPCLGLLWLSGKQASEYVTQSANRQELEELGRSRFRTKVLCNFYLDKRHRSLSRMMVFSESGFAFSQTSSHEIGLLLGFFATEPVSGVVHEGRDKYLMPLEKRSPDFLREIALAIPEDVSVNEVEIFTKDGYPHMKKGTLIQ